MMLQIEVQQKLQVEQNKTAAQIAKAQADAALKIVTLTLKEQKLVLDTQSQGAQEQMKSPLRNSEDWDYRRALESNGRSLMLDLLKAQRK